MTFEALKVPRGRPPLYHPTRAINFRADARIKFAFADLAIARGCQPSDLYRAAVVNYLKRAKVEWEK